MGSRKPAPQLNRTNILSSMIICIPMIALLVIHTYNLPVQSSPGSKGTIKTVAGTGLTGFSGDGGPATSADLARYIGGIAAGQNGELFIADAWNGRIRKVGPTGAIVTVAGCGRNGFSGDGGPALRAALSRPMSVAMDAQGDLFIADTFNNRVRKVTPDGRIRTVAGNGTRGFSGDGGPAVRAALNRPHGIAIDSSGVVYLTDTGNERVRRITARGTIETVAGTGHRGRGPNGGLAPLADLSVPTGVAIDRAGDVYIADTGNQRICEIVRGCLYVVAGRSPRSLPDAQATRNYDSKAAELTAPQGVAVSPSGDVFIADSGNSRIERVTTDGRIEVVAGGFTEGYLGDGGAAAEALLDDPVGLAVAPTGDLFVADTRNHRVRSISFKR